MRPLNIGIIGYGGFGAFLHRSWSELPDVRVAAIADADLRRDPGGVPFFTDWRELLDQSEIDALSIVTPPDSHADIACAAMQAGKHVLIEKPLATTMEDALRILSVQEQTGMVAGVDYMLRFNPIVEALHAWCRNGSFGPLRRVVVENYAQDESLGPDHWFWDRRRSGGILVEHAVHFIDLVNGCTSSEAVRVDGIAVSRNPAQEDRVMATVLYGDGLVATHYHAFSRPGFFERTTMRFVFDLAQVDIDGWIPLSGRCLALASDETEAELECLPGWSPCARRPVHDMEDDSRPHGWGATGNGSARTLRSGGVEYAADRCLEGTFQLPVDKSRAYGNAVRAIALDFAHAIRKPRHRLRAPLQAGVASLGIALQASSGARSMRGGIRS
jgi:predicted dehydrogenase